MDQNLQWRWARYAPLGAALARIGGALLLAYIFVIVMMTAIAQADVVDSLQGNYSAEYQQIAKLEDQRDERQRVFARWRESEPARDAAAAKLQRALAHYDTLEAPLRATANTVADPLCRPADWTPTERIAPTELGLVLSRLTACVQLKGAKLTPAGIDRQIGAELAKRDALLAAAEAWQTAYQDDQDADETLKDAAGAYNRMLDTYEASNGLRRQFAPVLLMRDHWLLGGRLLVQFPPAMMQLLIAFVSGAFGALLLALVLIVYPNNGLGLTQPGGNYGERILLGGLIAVCVAIVLGGGTAVLGTSGAGPNGETAPMNFQAFSAIGILAGMFADRVAQWLSDRAQTFYGERGAGGAGAEGAGGAGARGADAGGVAGGGSGPEGGAGGS